ncbi:MAG TPA: hypothetical protein VEJ23_03860 [Solirubrobacteraceae bacterium]|nr:hypothetical protein [Solirubrobacteraceae bacterium]
MIVDSAVLVLREGLEAILVLGPVSASFLGANKSKRNPVALGAGILFAAVVATGFAGNLADRHARWRRTRRAGGGRPVGGRIAARDHELVLSRRLLDGVDRSPSSSSQDKLSGSGGRKLMFGRVALGFTAV